MKLKIRATALLICLCMLTSILTSCGLEELIPDFMLPDESDSYSEIQNTVTVSIIDGEHYTVTSANPLRVGIGADATFTIEIEEGYEYVSNSLGAEYSDGTIKLNDVKRHASIDVATKKMDIIITHTHAGGTATCTAGAVCDECGQEYSDSLGHSISRTPASNAEEHWYACDRCDYTERNEKHSGGTATCATPATCAICGVSYGTALVHKWAETYTSDENNHWYACTNEGCEEKNSISIHYGGEATYDEQAICEGCGTSYGELKERPHEHSGGTATCNDPAVCDGCGQPYGTALGHKWSKTYTYDDSQHWLVCENGGCNEINGRTSHYGGEATYDEQAICEGCGAHYGELKHRHTGGTATCYDPAICESCGQSYGTALGHKWSESFVYDESNHWTKCENDGCNETINLASHYGGEATYDEQAICEGCGAHYGELKHRHTGGTATCTAPAICESCGQPYGTALGHKWSETYEHDDNLHWLVCENGGCNEISGLTSHFGGEATYDEKAICEGCGASYGNFQHRHVGGTATCNEAAICEDCGLPYGTALGHKWSETYTYNDDQHWIKCENAGCNEIINLASHYGGEATYDEKAICEGCGAHYGELKHRHVGGKATCYEPAICDDCGQPYGTALGHKWSESYMYDDNQHWIECTNEGCGLKMYQAAHTGGEATYDEKAVCDTCGAHYGELKHRHTGGKATCYEPAICEDCGLPYGTALGHKWSETYTYDENLHWFVCENDGCNEINECASHYGGEATYDEKAICEGCGTHYGELKHRHTGGTATCTTPATCESCGQLYGSPLGHAWGSTYYYDYFFHWRQCTRCYQTSNQEDHYGGMATYYDCATCEACKEPYGEPIPKPEFETITLEAAPAKDGYRFLCWTANVSAEEGGIVFGETASGTFQMPFEATPIANYVDEKHHVILYRTNGGKTADGKDFYYQTFSNKNYQMPNTINQNGTFVRDGYVLMMYTERADGGGEYTTLGGKIVPNDNGFIELYLQWGKVTTNGMSYTAYTREDGGLSACVQSYTGSATQVVIPATVKVYYNGNNVELTVDKIAAGAFKNASMSSAVIPHTVKTIEDGAFENCSNLVELTIHDNFTNVTDAAFKDAPISTVYMNAAQLPTSSDSYFCLKYEKVRMTYLQGKNTIIVMSGSSSLYGFYAQQMQEAFYGEYEVVNYGTNAGSSSIFYMNAFARFMDEGDVMLNAPEVGGNDAQMANPKLTRFTIRALERMYEVISYVDISEFNDFFTAVADNNANRGKDQSYEDANRSLVNEYTDLATNKDNFDYSGTSRFDPCSTGKLTEEKAARFNLVNERIRENGGVMYMSFAPVNIQECVDRAKDKAYQDAFKAHCEALLDYPIISHPGTYMMEQKYFTSGYHPGKTGAQIRTANLTADLKAQMIIDGLWYEE